VIVLFLLDLPDPSEASRSDLVQKFIVVASFLFNFDGLVIEGGGCCGVGVGMEGCIVAILFDRLLGRFILGSGDCHFEVFVRVGFVVLGTHQQVGGLGDIHIQCEFKVDLIVLIIDFEEEVGRRRSFFLFVLHLFDHFLIQTNYF